MSQSVLPGVLRYTWFRMAWPSPSPSDAEATDPPLLKENSRVRSFSANGFTYPEVRVFFRPRPKLEEFPNDPAPLPLLVLVHGLGGSVAQFAPLLTSLTNHSSCLAVDLPGCGRSSFEPQHWDAYKTGALANLLETVIDEYRDKERGQGVIFIAHSMGTAIAARLANKGGQHVTELPSYVLGLIGICPVAGPFPREKTATARKLLWIPTLVFDIWRWWDQRGGPQSASVSRFVGPEADITVRELQNKFNKQSRTPVFRRMAWGSLPTYIGSEPQDGLFGEPAWAGLDIPVFLIGAEKDAVTPPSEVDKIASLLNSKGSLMVTNGSKSSGTLGESAAPIIPSAEPTDRLPESLEDITAKDFERRRLSANMEDSFEEATTPRDAGESPGVIPTQPMHPRKVVKFIIMPAPATHTVLYSPKTVRILSGLITDFMSEHISGRLDFGWQLQHLNRMGKWDLKNLKKWQAVQPVSQPISDIFRAMKTLREVDEEHSPKAFSEKWGHIVKDVVDISKDDPVYDSRGLEREGIRYHKFPTVSKIPPTDSEVTHFIAMVGTLRISNGQC